jgi:serine carboxypeptidase-like clade 2
MYAGYITVDPAHGRKLFYTFVESYRDPRNDPLVLWLNGGPGCSSVAAFFEEHGPLLMDFNRPGTGVVLNPNTWATVANVIYLESPAGVGYSVSQNTTDYTTGDLRTAADSYAFLQGFLDEFPQFRSNPFWITGESYGGHYVPELAFWIQENNATARHPMNLQGWMAGNPWTDPEVEAFGVPQNWWDRGIISEPVWNEIQETCTYQDITFWIVNNVSLGSASKDRLRKNFFWERLADAQQKGHMPRSTINSKRCFSALYKATIKQFGGVDILEVYADVCNNGTKGNIPDQPNWCADNQLAIYMNQPSVQAAFYVGQPPSYGWIECSPYVHYSTVDTQQSVRWIYEKALREKKLSILVFSGDNDAIVPFTATRKWLSRLNLTEVEEFHEWYCDTNGPQVGGWATVYDGLTFTTVRDAGHEVPFMQPKRALHMFRTFIETRRL